MDEGGRELDQIDNIFLLQDHNDQQSLHLSQDVQEIVSCPGRLSSLIASG